MTGEITLSGNVLPIGGIKEKVLAAKRAGVRDVILPAENKTNVEEDLTPEQLENLNVHYVKTIDEVLELALPSSPREEKQDAEEREKVLSTPTCSQISGESTSFAGLTMRLAFFLGQLKHYEPESLQIERRNGRQFSMSGSPKVGGTRFFQIRNTRLSMRACRYLFFGVLKDIVGVGSEPLNCADGATLEDVLGHYEKRIPKIRGVLQSVAIRLTRNMLVRRSLNGKR